VSGKIEVWVDGLKDVCMCACIPVQVCVCARVECSEYTCRLARSLIYIWS